MRKTTPSLTPEPIDPIDPLHAHGSTRQFRRGSLTQYWRPVFGIHS